MSETTSKPNVFHNSKLGSMEINVNAEHSEGRLHLFTAIEKNVSLLTFFFVQAQQRCGFIFFQ